MPRLSAQVAGARRTIQKRFHVPVNWFCYPSGQYDAAVIAEVKAAGFRGSFAILGEVARDVLAAAAALAVLAALTPGLRRALVVVREVAAAVLPADLAGA